MALKKIGEYLLFFFLSAGWSIPLCGQAVDTLPASREMSDSARFVPQRGVPEAASIDGMTPQEAIALLEAQEGDTLSPREAKKLARLQKREEKRHAKELKKQEKLRREVQEYFTHVVTDTSRAEVVPPAEPDPLLDSLSVPNTAEYHKDDSTMIGEALMLKKPPAPKPKSAAHAAFLSAIVPGLGQIYGGSQWWMAPAFWGGMTGTLLAVSFYNGYYNDFRKEYKNRILTGEVHDYEYYDNATLVSQMQYAEQQRDLWILGTVGVYLLNILHANVSVQLSEFRTQRKHRKMLELQGMFERQDASSTLTFSPAMVHPNQGVNRYPAPGLQLAIHF